MATSTNIKQWKIDFLQALKDYGTLLLTLNTISNNIRRKSSSSMDDRKSDTKDSKSLRTQYDNVIIEFNDARIKLEGFQTKLVDALASDNIDSATSQKITSLFGSFFVKRNGISSYIDTLVSRYELLRPNNITKWITQYIDPLIIPGT